MINSNDIGKLTKQEMNILKLVSLAVSNKAIASSLFIDIKTVERHMSNIYNKLNIHASGDIYSRVAIVNMYNAFYSDKCSECPIINYNETALQI